MQILTKGGRHPGVQATRRSDRRAVHRMAGRSRTGVQLAA